MNTENTNNEDRIPGPINREYFPLPNKKESEDIKKEYKSLGRPLNILSVTESILKNPVGMIYELHHGDAKKLILFKFVISVLCLMVFGFTVGLFSGGSQLLAAPVKITGGILLSVLICLPSLFVFSCLAGADSSLSKMIGTIEGVITVSALLLLGLAPVSWIFAQSTDSVIFMGILYFVFWAISIHYGLQYMRKSLVLLNGKMGKHITIWSVIFILVMLQMSTTLRPIVGKHDKFLQTEKKFFLAHWAEQFDSKHTSKRR